MAVWTTGPALGDLEAGRGGRGDLGQHLDRERRAGVPILAVVLYAVLPGFRNYDNREHLAAPSTVDAAVERPSGGRYRRPAVRRTVPAQAEVDRADGARRRRRRSPWCGRVLAAAAARRAPRPQRRGPRAGRRHRSHRRAGARRRRDARRGPGGRGVAAAWRPRGTYDTGAEVLIRNRSLDGAPGYHVVTPLVMADGTAVLVNRGWVPAEPRGGRRPRGPRAHAGRGDRGRPGAGQPGARRPRTDRRRRRHAGRSWPGSTSPASPSRCPTRCCPRTSSSSRRTPRRRNPSRGSSRHPSWTRDRTWPTPCSGSSSPRWPSGGGSCWSAAERQRAPGVRPRARTRASGFPATQPGPHGRRGAWPRRRRAIMPATPRRGSVPVR